jgi:hypothetical protein
MTIAAPTAETVLRLLRQLTPREQLRVVARVLPELEKDLPPIPVSADFWQGSTMEALIEQQGVRPVIDFDALLGGWPESETVDEFIAAVHQWRQQNPGPVRVG